MAHGSGIWYHESLTNKGEINMSESSEELKRIAIALEEILRLVKKDMDDSKARITAQWDKELDKKDLPFPEVE
jgi:hypothetical protein